MRDRTRGLKDHNVKTGWTSALQASVAEHKEELEHCGNDTGAVLGPGVQF